MKSTVRRVTGSLALLGAAIWLGGLVALGAIAAPIVFSVAPWPASADAMTLVFRRFDTVAMACAAVVLTAEALLAAGRVPWTRTDVARTAFGALAAAAAVFEGVVISPRIAALHVAGVIRGVGSAGAEMARLHDLAETCGKTEVVLLAAFIVLHGLSLPHGDRVARVDARSPEK
jgi:putative copper export protein